MPPEATMYIYMYTYTCISGNERVLYFDPAPLIGGMSEKFYIDLQSNF